MRFLMPLCLILLSVLAVSRTGQARDIPEMDSPVAQDIARGMAGRVPAPLEGIWRIAGEKSLIGIRPSGPDKFEIVSIDCEAPSVLPGTVMGYASATARPLTYDADIFTKVGDGVLRKSDDFLITVSDDGNRFTMRHYKQGKSIRLWRFLPYLFRYSVSSVNTRPEDIDGCIRVWPPAERPYKKIVL